MPSTESQRPSGVRSLGPGLDVQVDGGVVRPHLPPRRPREGGDDRPAAAKHRPYQQEEPGVKEIYSSKLIE